jgi:hypothetical protein
VAVAEKLIALFNALTLQEVQAMAPAQRRRFADTCRHWAEQAEPSREPPKAGVLADLRNCQRTE